MFTQLRQIELQKWLNDKNERSIDPRVQIEIGSSQAPKLSLGQELTERPSRYKDVEKKNFRKRNSSRTRQRNERLFRQKDCIERKQSQPKEISNGHQTNDRRLLPRVLRKRFQKSEDRGKQAERHIDPEIYVDVDRLQECKDLTTTNVYEKRLKENIIKREKWLKEEALRRQTETERQAIEAFVSRLIEGVHRIKRDREVREKLNGWLEKLQVQNTKQATGQFRSHHISVKRGENHKRQPRVHWDNNTLRVTSRCPSPLTKTAEKPKDRTGPKNQLVVGYFFGANSIPFTTRFEGDKITLAQFKALVNKKGKYKYFFKKHSTEFGTEAVFEEISDEKAFLPLWEGKIYAIVETKG